MIIYRIKYQTKRQYHEREGEWQDTDKVVVAGEDAREAVSEVVDSLSEKSSCYDFRLVNVERIGYVDIIARGIVFGKSKEKILK